jgi:putative membrane protein insertion efficiency factor
VNLPHRDRQGAGCAHSDDAGGGRSHRAAASVAAPAAHARGLAALPRQAGRALIWLYRHTLSPLVGYECRHLPTCSQYGDEALARFGLWAGGWMTLARLCRCHPFGTSGLDFVPAALPPRACWYMPWRYGRWRGTNATPEAPLAPPDPASPAR